MRQVMAAACSGHRGRAVGVAAVHAAQGQAVQVNVEVGGGPEAMHQPDGATVAFVSDEPGGRGDIRLRAFEPKATRVKSGETLKVAGKAPPAGAEAPTSCCEPWPTPTAPGSAGCAFP